MNLFMTELRVREWPATFHWYRDVLGLVPEFEDVANRFVLFRAGASRLALKAGHPHESARDEFSLVFEVPDVDAVRCLLEARGVAVDEPFDSPLNEGYREARLRDPENNRVRIFSWKAEG